MHFLIAVTSFLFREASGEAYTSRDRDGFEGGRSFSSRKPIKSMYRCTETRSNTTCFARFTIMRLPRPTSLSRFCIAGHFFRTSASSVVQTPARSCSKKLSASLDWMRPEAAILEVSLSHTVSAKHCKTLQFLVVYALMYGRTRRRGSSALIKHRPPVDWE